MSWHSQAVLCFNGNVGWKEKWSKTPGLAEKIFNPRPNIWLSEASCCLLDARQRMARGSGLALDVAEHTSVLLCACRSAPRSMLTWMRWRQLRGVTQGSKARSLPSSRTGPRLLRLRMPPRP